MTIFEITGKQVKGGDDASHNETLLGRVKDLESFIQSIGTSLGMASLDSAFVKTEKDGYGFRFASTSEEKYDARGIELKECEQPSDLVAKLG